MAPGRWIVKGAYAIDLRLGSRGRATREVDRSRRDDSTAVLLGLRDAGAIDVGDYFRFAVERSRRSLGRDHHRDSRFRVAADLAAGRLDTLTVDVAVGEILADEPDLIGGPDFRTSAGTPRTRLPAIRLELQVAEKVHAYTWIYSAGRRNSRVKDLVDLVQIA